MKDINNGSDEENENTTTDNEKKSGKLTVNAVKEVDTKDIPATGTSIVDSLTISTDEEITVKSITLKLSNYTKASAIKEVWFEKEGQVISNKKSTFTDNEVLLTLKKGLTVKKSETIDLVVTTNGETNANIGFVVSNVESTAENAKIKNAETTVCKTITYTTTKIAFNMDGSDSSYEKDDDIHEFAKFKIEGGSRNDKDVNISSITLNLSGSAKISYLTDFEVRNADGKKISSSYTLGNDKITISFNDVVKTQKTNTYYLMAKVDEVGSTEDTYEFYLDDGADVIAYEEGTSARAEIDNQKSTKGLYTIKGGDITLKATQTVQSVQGNWGNDEFIVVAEGNITAIEGVEVRGDKNNPSLTITTSDAEFTGINRLQIVIAGTPYEADLSGANTYVVKEDITIPAGNSKMKVNVKLDSKAIAGVSTIHFNNITSTSFRGGANSAQYSTNSEKKFDFQSKFVGNLTMANINIVAGSVIVDKTTTKTLKLNQVKRDGTVFEGSIKNEGNTDVKLTNIILSGTVTKTGKLDTTSYITPVIAVNGKNTDANEKKVTLKTAGSEVELQKFKINSTTIKAGESVNITFTIDDSYLSGVSKIDFIAGLEAEDNNGDPIKDINTINASVEYSEIDVVKTSSSNKSSVLMHNTTKQLIGEARIEVKNGDAQLNQGVIDFGGTSEEVLKKLSSISVEIEGINTMIFPLDTDAAKATKTNIAKSISEGYHDVKIYANLGDFKEVANNEIKLNTITFDFDEKSNVAVSINTTKTVYPARVIVARKNALSENNLVLTLKNDSDETVTITGISLSVDNVAKVMVDGIEYTGSTHNNATIKAGQSIEVKVTVTTENNSNKNKVFVEGINYYVVEGKGLETSTTNFSELDWDNFYAVY